MSATVLVNGKLARDPEQRISRAGNPFGMATIREGQGDDAVFWRIFVFSNEAREELMTLRAGDGVAVSGSLKAEVYSGGAEPRVSLTVTADRLISAKRQKREKAAEGRADAKVERNQDRAAAPDDRPFDDGVPF